MTCFQFPKHVIKAKDPRIVRIDVAILGFLIGPSLEETLEVKLISKQVIEIIQAKNQRSQFKSLPSLALRRTLKF